MTGRQPQAAVDPGVSPDLTRQVEQALGRIEDPCSESLKAGWSVLDLGLLVDVTRTDGGGLAVELTLTDPMCPFFELLEERVRDSVREVTGVDDVTVDISHDVAWDPRRLRRGPLTLLDTARSDDEMAATRGGR